MNKDEIAKKWRRLDPIPFEEISKARDIVHEAIQLIASTGISYVQKRQDDSHTNCEWSRNLKSFVGNLFGKENKICLGLTVSELKLLFLKENWTVFEELNLDNKSLDDVIKWLKKNFENTGLDFNQFTLERHYEIPINKIITGGIFKLANKRAYQELSDYYANADLILRKFISEKSNTLPVRCWPHHFDIATLLNIGEERLQSIGIGMSPGIKNNNEPYFYVTMWPYPDLEQVSLQELSIGNWNVDGWIGASLTASEIIKNTDEHSQSEIVLGFITNSVSAIKKTLLNNI